MRIFDSICMEFRKFMRIRHPPTSNNIATRRFLPVIRNSKIVRAVAAYLSCSSSSSTIHLCCNRAFSHYVSCHHQSHQSSPFASLIIEENAPRIDFTKVSRQKSSAPKTTKRASSSSSPESTNNDNSTTTTTATATATTTTKKAYHSTGYWADPANQRQFFDKIAKELGINRFEDWYNVTVQQVQRFRGGFAVLKRYHGNSLARALQSVYPEHDWQADQFTRVPKRFWDDLANQRHFFDKIGRDLGVQHWEDWYDVSVRELKSRGASGLLREVYGDSLARALPAIYPEHPWQPTRFAKAPHRYWKSLENQRQFFDKIASELGIREPEDWYRVTVEQIYERGGRSALKYYGGSLLRALQAVYPEHVSWRSPNPRAPYQSWQDESSKRLFFDRLAQELGIKNLDDWYNVSLEDIRSRGGGWMLSRYYQGSLAKALQALHPEHPWQRWRFSSISLAAYAPQPQPQPRPHHTSGDNTTTTTTSAAAEAETGLESADITATDAEDTAGAGEGADDDDDDEQEEEDNDNDDDDAEDKELSLLRDYMDALGKELNIKHLDDWYRASLDEIRRFGGYRHIKRNGGLALVLRRLHPQHSWDEKRFQQASSKRSSQWRLLLTINKLFPNQEIVEEFHHPQLVFAKTNESMELDIYIPSLSLAFEYHGEQHYKDLYLFGAHSKSLARDNEKTIACNKLGITLVAVPYWWDRKLESLAATIISMRPDLRPAIIGTVAASINKLDSNGATATTTNADQIVDPLWIPIPQAPPTTTTTASHNGDKKTEPQTVET